MIMLDKYTSRTAYWRFRAITDWLVYLCLSLWQINSSVWPALSENYPLSSITDLNDTNFTHIQIHSAWAIRHLKIEFWKINDSTILGWYFLLTKFHFFGEVPIGGMPFMSMHWNQIVPMGTFQPMGFGSPLDLHVQPVLNPPTSILSIRFFFSHWLPFATSFPLKTVVTEAR